MVVVTEPRSVFVGPREVTRTAILVGRLPVEARSHVFAVLAGKETWRSILHPLRRYLRSDDYSRNFGVAVSKRPIQLHEFQMYLIVVFVDRDIHAHTATEAFSVSAVLREVTRLGYPHAGLKQLRKRLVVMCLVFANDTFVRKVGRMGCEPVARSAVMTANVAE